ncbi:MAG: hypothetical protein NVS3B20_23040 [Polyangiales bacterium]
MRAVGEPCRDPDATRLVIDENDVEHLALLEFAEVAIVPAVTAGDWLRFAQESPIKPSSDEPASGAKGSDRNDRAEAGGYGQRRVPFAVEVEEPFGVVGERVTSRIADHCPQWPFGGFGDLAR